MMEQFYIQKAEEENVNLILSFIKELAAYEKMTDDVVATEKDIAFALFEEKSAHCVLAFEGANPIGFALYFFNFSTFLGKKGLYLEDVFVKPAYRNKGYGKALLTYLRDESIGNNCGRMEWSVLDWNQSAIDFYENFGAKAMNEWTTFRLNDW
jgi:GNAT superfamily N-acetyltransferase